MAIEIRSGPAQVIANGTATTFGGSGLGITVDLPDGPTTVALEFVTDPSRDDVAVESVDTADGWTIVLTNFDAPDGRGSARPVLLGELSDALVFFHFRVFRYGRTADRTVHYTFFRVPKDAVGWTPVEPRDEER